MGPVPRTLEQHTLPLNTDVAEWCPQPGAERLLAVSTYQLDEATQTRQGGLHLFAFQDEATADEAGTAAGAVTAASGAAHLPGQHLAQLACLDLPGVFDLRWHPRSAMPTLAAALADGSVRVLTLDSSSSSSSSSSGGSSSGNGHARGGSCNRWERVAAAVAAAAEAGPAAATTLASSKEAEGMAVSLDYSRCQGSEGDLLAVSYSSGQLQLFQATPTGMTSLAVWQAHQLEAWAAATDHWHPSLLHSGGDDCAYRLWDSRKGFDAPVWQSSRAHGAGVCCAASSPHQEHIACTGAYDDHLRLWDLRAPQRPVQLAELNCGGGVWRAKWHPSEPRLLLAACMYNGFALLRLDGAERQLEIVSTYEHAPGSLSYGADWCRLGGKGGTDSSGGHSSEGTLAATASFYDRQLHLWDTGV